MANLWIYWRRPSSMVRYRHGGESAIYPLLKQSIVGSLHTAQAAVATQTVVTDAASATEDNVLDFTAAQRRAERGRPIRKSRSKGKPKRRE